PVDVGVVVDAEAVMEIVAAVGGLDELPAHDLAQPVEGRVEAAGGLRLRLAWPEGLRDLEGRHPGAVLEQVVQQFERLERVPVEALTLTRNDRMAERLGTDVALDRSAQLFEP